MVVLQLRDFFSLVDSTNNFEYLLCAILSSGLGIENGYKAVFGAVKMLFGIPASTSKYLSCTPHCFGSQLPAIIHPGDLG